jgi:hypothetical protein
MGTPEEPTEVDAASDAEVAANDRASADLGGTIVETLANLAAGVARALP